jgi:hypothetical protein
VTEGSGCTPRPGVPEDSRVNPGRDTENRTRGPQGGRQTSQVSKTHRGLGSGLGLGLDLRPPLQRSGSGLGLGLDRGHPCRGGGHSHQAGALRPAELLFKTKV